MRALALAALLTSCGEPINRPHVDEDPSFPILNVELDAMLDRALSDDVLKYARAAFHDAGINIRFNRDDEAIEPIEFDGSNEQRNQILADTRSDPNAVHVLVAIRRTDLPGRGGEVISGEINQSGVIIYWDELDELHPACGSPEAPSISEGEARAATLIHEIGHTLQAGHDTERNEWINFWNVMSVPDNCEQSQQRFHGRDNIETQWGATEMLQAARFSRDAIERFNFENIVSIHTGEYAGEEM